MSNNKRFHILDDFGKHDCKMGVQCQGCGHRGVIGAWTIVMSTKMKPSTPIAEAVSRMRCSECGRRGPRWWPSIG